jgi:general secretion pathway protein D
MNIFHACSVRLDDHSSSPHPARSLTKSASVRLARWLVIAALGVATACSNGTGNEPPTKAGGEQLIRRVAAGTPTPQPLVAPDTATASPPPSPIIISGDGQVVGATPIAGADPPAEPGDITLNFVDTDVREVVRAVLGDVLHLNYTVDSKVQGTITVQTSRPLRRDQVLPTFQEVLRTSGLAVVDNGGLMRVVSIDDAARSGGAALVVGQGPRQRVANPAYNVQILPLKYVSASELRQTIEPMLPKGAIVQVDTTRNLLMLSGNGQDLSTVTELVRTFDVDWLKGMSFGIFPLQVSTPTVVASELNEIFGPNGGVPLAGVLHFAPLERMNAILAVSPQRAYLEQARSWVERLDHGSADNVPRLFEYHVQNSRAADLAKVLSELFSGEVRTVEPATAPGSSQLQLSQSNNGSASSLLGAGGLGSNSGLPTMGGLGAGGTSLTPGLGATPTASPLGAAGTTATSSATQSGGDQSGTGGAKRPQSSGLAAALSGAAGGDRRNGNNDFELPQVRIVADEKNNTLVIFARPREYHMIEEALKRLDVVPLQVLIEATIAEVTLNNDLQYGLQWFFKKGGSNITLSNAVAGGVPQVFPGFNYAFIAGGANIVLSALSAITNVNVVSSPQLLVLDHHVATLQVGDEVPVPTAQIESTLTAGAPIVNTIQYLNTGVILRVSPRVNSNGVITLEISQEVSDVTATTSSTLNAPTINQRRVESTVSVADGDTVALAGLIRENQSLTKSGLPIVSNIPVVGNLFKSTDDNKGRTELLILLAPHVVHNPTEAKTMTDEVRSRLHAIEPVLEHAR